MECCGCSPSRIVSAFLCRFYSTTVCVTTCYALTGFLETPLSFSLGNFDPILGLDGIIVFCRVTFDWTIHRFKSEVSNHRLNTTIIAPSFFLLNSSVVFVCIIHDEDVNNTMYHSLPLHQHHYHHHRHPHIGVDDNDDDDDHTDTCRFTTCSSVHRGSHSLSIQIGAR